MTDTTAQQNMERSHQAHCIPGRKISIDNMRGYRFAEVALFTGTSAENAIADFYNSTGVDDPTPARFAALDKDQHRTMPAAAAGDCLAGAPPG